MAFTIIQTVTDRSGEVQVTLTDRGNRVVTATDRSGFGVGRWSDRGVPPFTTGQAIGLLLSLTYHL